ncbi:MAG TPA: hypothetical protein VMQ67_07125, partial [Candidatus Saccharimonadales bacterium]|nr:hypothetical protein [Candidatus Saccharimonadales bacterium]
MKVLVIDVGGTHIKLLATGQKQKLEFPSGLRMTARKMVVDVKLTVKAAGWKYDVISMGYPGPVLHDRPMVEPHNLGKGWVKF